MNNSNGNKLVGAILIIVGGLWIVDNFNVFSFFNFSFFSWNTFFVIAGAIIISNNSRSFWGYLLIGIGVIGWLKNMPFFPFAHLLNFRDLWPLIILGIGVWMILRKNESTNCINRQHIGNQNTNQNNQANANSFASPGTHESSFDYVNEMASFTSIEKVITSQSFKGGKIAASFGSIKLDFRQAKMAPGEHILDLSATFGGVELYFPHDWKVIVNVSSVFGGFDDQRYPGLNAAASGDSLLIIKGSVVFGGGELKN